MLAKRAPTMTENRKMSANNCHRNCPTELPQCMLDSDLWGIIPQSLAVKDITDSHIQLPDILEADVKQ